MTHKEEAIELLARRYDYYPASFHWRGRRFDVVAVEKCWRLQQPVLCRMFRVRCQAGTFILEQRLATDGWYVRRWPLAFWLPRPQSGPAPRFPLPRRRRRLPSPSRLPDRPAAPLVVASPPRRNRPWTVLAPQT